MSNIDYCNGCPYFLENTKPNFSFGKGTESLNYCKHPYYEKKYPMGMYLGEFKQGEKQKTPKQFCKQRRNDES